MSPPGAMAVDPRSASFILVVWTGALGAAWTPAWHGAGKAGPGREVPPGITVLREQHPDATRYRPRLTWWGEAEVRVYPFIIAGADGGRQIALHVSRVARDTLRMNTVRFFVDGKLSRFEFRKVATDRSGCLPAEWVDLYNQDDLIRAIPESQETRVVLQGKRAQAEYVLTPADHVAFRSVLDLYDAPTLPSIPGPIPGAGGKGDKEASGFTWPVSVQKITPQFPPAAQGKRGAGRVVLQALVRKDGRTEVLDVLESSAPYCGFEDAAIEAVRMWQYKPGTKDGQPVDIDFTIVIEFKSR